MDLEPVKVEEQDRKDIQMATATADPYAAAARALAEAQRVLSVARSAPQAPMISVEEAEKQANKLKAEIATLTESLAQERARTVALQAVADAANGEKDNAHRARDVAELEMQVLKETHARESAGHRTQLDALKASTDREREALNQQREAMEKKHESFMDVIAKRRSRFEAERDRAQKAILEHRKLVLENFDQMTKLLQPNPFPITYQDPTPAPAPSTSPLLPAQRSPKTPQHNASVPAKRPRLESGPTPKSQSDTSAAKRARIESSPQVSNLVIPVTPVANNKFYPKHPRKEPSFQFPSHNIFTDPKRLRKWPKINQRLLGSEDT